MGNPTPDNSINAALGGISPARGEVRPRLDVLAVGAFSVTVTGLWLILHPYAGFEHDARIYLLLALHWLDPETYRQDILVAYGSQGAFTAFPALAGTFIDWLGDASRGMFVTWLACYAVFLVGLAALIRTLLPNALRALAFGLVLVIPGDYGISGFLAYGEAISTPRPAAEGLVLLAASLWLGRRTIAAALAMALAFVLHPLVAAPGLLVLGASSLAPRRQAILAALAVAAACAFLGLASVGAGGPFAAMDAEWLSVVRGRAPYLFPDQWSLEEWNRALLPLAWLVLALQALDRDCRFRAILHGAFWVGLVGMLLAIGTAIVPNVVLVQGQPWRWMWVAKLVSVALLPLVVPRLWRQGGVERGAVMLALSGWLTSDVGGGLLVVAATVLLACAAHLSRQTRDSLSRASTLVFILSLGWSLLQSIVNIGGPGVALSASGLVRPVYGLMERGAIPAGLVLLAWWLAFRRGSRGQATATASLVLLLVAPAALALVEQVSRTNEYRHLALAKRAEGQAAVAYWPGEPVRTWLQLRSASYLSMVQSTVSLFSRPAAMELVRRNALAAPLHAYHDITSWNERNSRAYVPSEEAVRTLCADDMLDYLVLPESRDMASPLPGIPMASAGNQAPGLWWVDCAMLRMATGNGR